MAQYTDQTENRASHIRKRARLGPAVIFFAALAAVTVLAWILPLRPTVSFREKRNLERFPAFSWAALADGSYFNRIGIWFSDTFPGRDTWIQADQTVERLYGTSDVVIYGQIQDVAAEPEATPRPTPVPPTSTPKPAAGAMAAETPAATSEPEETPAEEEYVWGGKVIEEEDLINVGATVQIGDSVYEIASYSEYYAQVFAENMNRCASLLEGKSRVFSVVVPSGASVMLPRDFRESINAGILEDTLELIRQKLDGAIGVDTFHPLLRHNGEYIYFHADHHWTALGAWYVYEEWAKTAGFQPVGLEEYTETVQEPFLGSLYYKAHQNSRLQKDSVHAYVPPGDIHLFIEYENQDSPANLGREQELIVDVRGTDKYLCFLSGDVPLCTFVNNDIDDGSACLLVKDSNGNPFSYFLTQHYQYVHVIDFRKYNHHTVPDFVDIYGVDDVIFCFGASHTQGYNGNELIRRLIG